MSDKSAPPITPAHSQQVAIHLLECVPSHEPRETDPHHKYFEAARERLKKLGKLVCWIGNCDCSGDIELHHTMVEESLRTGIDIARFEQLYPEFGVTTDEQFLEWVEGSADNLTPLCRIHHTGILGIHLIPMPLWQSQRYWKAGIPLAAKVILEKDAAPASPGK